MAQKVAFFAPDPVVHLADIVEPDVRVSVPRFLPKCRLVHVDGSLAVFQPGVADLQKRLGSSTFLTANCIIIDHFSAFEPGLVAPFLYAA